MGYIVGYTASACVPPGRRSMRAAFEPRGRTQRVALGMMTRCHHITTQPSSCLPRSTSVVLVSALCTRRICSTFSRRLADTGGGCITRALMKGLLRAGGGGARGGCRGGDRERDMLRCGDRERDMLWSGAPRFFLTSGDGAGLTCRVLYALASAARSAIFRMSSADRDSTLRSVAKSSSGKSTKSS